MNWKYIGLQHRPLSLHVEETVKLKRDGASDTYHVTIYLTRKNIKYQGKFIKYQEENLNKQELWIGYLYATFNTSNHTTSLDELWVRENYWRQGYGSKLVKDLIKIAKAHESSMINVGLGAPHAASETKNNIKNYDRALFYQTLGFVPDSINAWRLLKDNPSNECTMHLDL